MIKKGKYEHYKGATYTVIDFALHTETKEIMVVYTADYDIKNLDPVLRSPPKFVRPLEMFLEKVEVNGTKVERFAFVDARD